MPFALCFRFIRPNPDHKDNTGRSPLGGLRSRLFAFYSEFFLYFVQHAHCCSGRLVVKIRSTARLDKTERRLA
jgi:hypothetical protein